MTSSILNAYEEAKMISIEFAAGSHPDQGMIDKPFSWLSYPPLVALRILREPEMRQKPNYGIDSPSIIVSPS